jgi:hypothetical protein
MGRVVCLAVALALAAAPSAGAHGILERAEPRAAGVVKTAPTQVRLWFTGALEPAYSRVQVVDAAGNRVDLADSSVDGANRAELRVSVSALASGLYRVVWRVLSVDGHVTEGEYLFRVAP